VVTEPACGVTWVEPSWKRGDGSQLALLSVMAKGDENCCELPKMDEIENISAENQDKVVQFDIFTDTGESAQAERDRKEQEEREKAAAIKEKEAAAKEEEAEKNRSKKVSVFKRWVDNVMNMGESFFEERDENGQDSAN
ncbi:MAG: hypothetical protein J6V95_01065, partial [Bacteroidaceae bacterium]|nr:hypothetical protein [Bacteroidaceae bacterium]